MEYELDGDGDTIHHTKDEKWTRCYGDMFKVVTETVDILPPAVYNIGMNSSGDYLFQPKKQNSDEVYDLPGLPLDIINTRVDKFWESRAAYEKWGFIHKTGIILHGPAGNGKTCVITSLVNRLLAQGGVVINVSTFSMASEALCILKKAEPNRKVMTLTEDMDTLLSGESKIQEQHALSMLDGQSQVNGVVHVATTNYPEQLADRFIKRPGRFDLVIGMGMPSAVTRRAYFQKILRDDHHPQLNYLVNKTEGMALAYLREVCTSYLCLGIPVDETLDRLQKNINTHMKPTKAYGRTENLGFQVGYAEGEGEEALPTQAVAGRQ